MKSFSQCEKDLVNPPRVVINYNNPPELSNQFEVDVWSAMMDVAVHAYTIKDMALSQIDINDTSVFFILKNSLNNVLVAI